MRVISGTARGRRLIAPDGLHTRPTSDRVREATFNALGSLDAVVDATVVDLFAGSGALGIEALSRGAASVTFVDRDREARRVIEANLATCGLAAQATIVSAPVDRFLADHRFVADQPGSPADQPGQRARFDLALVDPPYDFDGWPELLDAIPAVLVVAETAREIDPPEGWTVLRSRRYGRTWVTFLEAPQPA